VTFAVSAAFVLSNHLGFVVVMKKEMAVSMKMGKLAVVITAASAAAGTTPAYTAKKQRHNSLEGSSGSTLLIREMIQ
ncbi:UNVERIFIED_CONTAM: ethanolamine utilization protein EutH, partial [Bacillus subtilis]